LADLRLFAESKAAESNFDSALQFTILRRQDPIFSGVSPVINLASQKKIDLKIAKPSASSGYHDIGLTELKRPRLSSRFASPTVLLNVARVKTASKAEFAGKELINRS
jgi:hypothetical protein